MSAHYWGALLGPIASLILFGVVGLSIKWLIATKMPAGKLRDALLRERFPSKYSASNRRVLERASRTPRGQS